MDDSKISELAHKLHTGRCDCGGFGQEDYEQAESILKTSIVKEEITHTHAVGMTPEQLDAAFESPYIGTLHEDLRHVFNKHSVEGGANIPDSILATYTIDCLKALNTAVRRRDKFFGISVFPGAGTLQTSEKEPPTLDPTCLAAWPECKDGMYDPRCCRFPKACSPILETAGVVIIEEAVEGTEE